MKRFYLLLFSVVLGWTSLEAQITVTTASVPEVGDTLYTRVDITPNISFDADMTGEFDLNWSQLSGPNLIRTAFLPASEGSADRFRNADAVTLLDGGGEFYYNMESDGLYEVGIFGADPVSGGLNLSGSYTNGLKIRSVPLEYGDQHQLETALLFPVSAEIIPDSLLEELPVQPDSFRLNIGIERYDTVNGYGFLNVDGPTFEVLQEKRVEYRQLKVEAFVSFAGWLDVTEAVQELLPNFIDGDGRDTLVSYNYFSNDAKEPIAVVNVDTAGMPMRVEYKAQRTTSAPQRNLLSKADIKASPNPGIGLIKFTITDVPPANYTIKVRNIVGQTLWKDSVYISEKGKFSADLTHLQRGTYFYSLVDENGNTLVTKRLVFVRA